jgi:predicted transcriptional regulator
MTIANELSADVATAILVNTKGNRKELLKLIETVHLELRRLSLESHSSSRQRHRSNVSKSIRQNTQLFVEEELRCAIALKCQFKNTHSGPNRSIFLES